MLITNMLKLSHFEHYLMGKLANLCLYSNTRKYFLVKKIQIELGTSLFRFSNVVFPADHEFAKIK